MAVAEQIERENELKEELLARLDIEHDIDTLRELFLLLEKKSPRRCGELSQTEKDGLERGRVEQADGRCVSHDQLREKVARCLR